MRIKPPKTLKDFQGIREVILELMANPHCDSYMLGALSMRLIQTEIKIKELTK